jgi:hypothetical protein
VFPETSVDDDPRPASPDFPVAGDPLIPVSPGAPFVMPRNPHRVGIGPRRHYRGGRRRRRHHRRTAGGDKKRNEKNRTCCQSTHRHFLSIAPVHGIFSHSKIHPPSGDFNARLCDLRTTALVCRESGSGVPAQMHRQCALSITGMCGGRFEDCGGHPLPSARPDWRVRRAQGRLTAAASRCGRRHRGHWPGSQGEPPRRPFTN